MGGAAVAAPLEGMGALYWNPATISGLQSSELGFSMELILSDLTLSSSIPGAGAGADGAEPGVSVVPGVGWIHRPSEESPWTYGLGLFGVAGFRTNYPASSTNPILTLPPPNGAGFGRVFSDAEFLEMAPTASYAVNESFSIGIAPTVTMGRIAADPLALAPPDDANGDLAPTYPSGRGTRVNWGGGAKLGVYYIADNSWRFGASIKSPQWMEVFRYKSEDELGRPRTLKVKFDLPMIISAGAAYTGVEDTVVAFDVRYFDYKNTDGWGPGGFAADGSLNGLGWSNVFALAVGAQRKMNDQMYLRLGYSYNQNPIKNSESIFNIASPLLQEHMVHAGASYWLAENLAMNMAYTYVVENSRSGPVVLPSGPIGGSSVTSKGSAHVLSMGATVSY